MYWLAPPGILGGDAFEHSVDSVNTSVTRGLVAGCHGFWRDVPLSWEMLKMNFVTAGNRRQETTSSSRGREQAWVTRSEVVAARYGAV